MIEILKKRYDYLLFQAIVCERKFMTNVLKHFFVFRKLGFDVKLVGLNVQGKRLKSRFLGGMQGAQI
jgi:hypothetical protein